MTPCSFVTSRLNFISVFPSAICKNNFHKMGKVKIRGIFATWTVADVAKSPEMVVRLNLEKNPTHPFVPCTESSNKLILRMRSQQIFIGIITLLIAGLIAAALYYTQGNDSLRGGGSSIFSVPAFIGAWGLALVVFNVQVNNSIFICLFPPSTLFLLPFVGFF